METFVTNINYVANYWQDGMVVTDLDVYIIQIKSAKH